MTKVIKGKGEEQEGRKWPIFLLVQTYIPTKPCSNTYVGEYHNTRDCYASLFIIFFITH